MGGVKSRGREQGSSLTELVNENVVFANQFWLLKNCLGGQSQFISVEYI